MNWLLFLIPLALAQQGAELFTGGYKRDSQRNDANHVWTTGPALKGALKSLTCSFDFRDQCWGNKKGHVRARCGNGAAQELAFFTTRSKCNWQNKKVTKSFSCAKGQKIQILYTVGGGGGHVFYGKNLKCSMRVTVTKTRMVTVSVPTPNSSGSAGTKNDYSSTNSVKTWGTINLSAGKKATSISGSFQMKDQCWGNAKGRVYLNCGGKRQELGFYAKNYRRNYKTFNFNKSVSGSSCKVEYVVGGGGGHRIHLKNFRATVKYAPGSKQVSQSYTAEEGQEVITFADVVAVSDQTLADMDLFYKALAEQTAQEEIVQEFSAEALFMGVADVEQFEEHLQASKVSYYHMAGAGALVLLAFAGGRFSLASKKEYEPLV